MTDAEADNSMFHDDPADYIWDETDVVEIQLNGNSITVNGSGATAYGSIVTIGSAGNYRITGNLTDGQVIVDTEDESIVRLILNGVNIHNASNAPVFIKSAEKSMIVLQENSNNFLSDAASYIYEDAEEDEPNATVFSKDDLTIFGNGSLTVEANYNDGIASKDGLIIASGKIAVTAADDGIRGKDYLVVKDGDITIDAGGDGFKSDNDDDPTLGYIKITDGKFVIDSGDDVMQAESDILISDGDLELTSGGGSGNSYNTASSAKGIKSALKTVIDGGTFVINTADDAIHSNGSLTINAGTFNISTGDDGIHADTTVEINGGIIDIAKSYEGIESAVIIINDGNIHVVANDDGINVAGGNDSSGFGRPGQGSFGSMGNYFLYINGGYIYVDSNGDGLDANGSIVMTDGTVIVNGPTANNNGALDYDGTFSISGGLLVAAGSAGMAQAPGSSSLQESVLVRFNSSLSAGTLFHIQDSEGTEIVTFAPSKKYQSVAFSANSLKAGVSFEVYYGGNSTGLETDGLYEGGSYTGGTNYGSFSIQ